VGVATAEILLAIAAGYTAAGVCVAVGFLFLALDRIDAAAHEAYAFRPLLLPGLILLWPYVLLRWLRLERGAG
jgi:hypothetical protein